MEDLVAIPLLLSFGIAVDSPPALAQQLNYQVPLSVAHKSRTRHVPIQGLTYGQQLRALVPKWLQKMNNNDSSSSRNSTKFKCG